MTLTKFFRTRFNMRQEILSRSPSDGWILFIIFVICFFFLDLSYLFFVFAVKTVLCYLFVSTDLTPIFLAARSVDDTSLKKRGLFAILRQSRYRVA